MQKNCLNWRVEIAEDIFGESPILAEIFEQASGEKGVMPKVLIVADINVVQRRQGLGASIGKYFQNHKIRLAGNPVILAGGEKIKFDNFQSAMKVVNAILENKLGPDDLVLAIGGGAVLDVAGYGAALARGGVKVVRLPTSPAAMIDAAYAEYAALDAPAVKDGLRVRSEVVASVIDLAFASTVLDGVWRGGAGEAVRLAAVSDAPMMRKIEKVAEKYRERDAEALAEIVTTSLAVRKKKGGTSFAEWSTLRLQALSAYKIPHGYAAAIGVCIDTLYAVHRGYIKDKEGETIRGVLAACGAMDGLAHSRQFLAEPGDVLFGLEEWQFSHREKGLVLPAGIGKSRIDAEPDHATFADVMKLLSVEGVTEKSEE